ncbi:bifunctional chorismate mutase/prephenate dehydratase [Porcipelethomonas sp.]|uniref:bifunctional chorismate mutase/prephenate dehydratase n=1 Tax=Porcipelethomonas sp. TaxID=2981675 RepID=UPI003EF9239B
MDLDLLRNEIDKLDKEILSAFEKRMDLCRQVAIYKKENNLPIFQEGREKEIIKKVRNNAPAHLEDSSAALFTEIMDISKCLQQQELLKNKSFIEPVPFDITGNARIGCQGTSGSNSETAARKLFNDKEIVFYQEFEDVFSAVENGDIQFGIIPIHNSTAGSVTQNYDLMRKYNVFIARTVKVEITNCLAVKKGTKFSDIEKVYSHPQALKQCSKFIKESGFEPVESKNTATAAKYVIETSKPCAAICSENCAKLYNMEILRTNISDVIPNFTRFICISKQFMISKDAKTIAVTLEIPNTKGSLFRLLTKFFVNNMNLEKIESRPIADGSFDVMFYLDFSGNINDPKVKSLLIELSDELEYFKFLGNYSEEP